MFYQQLSIHRARPHCKQVKIHTALLLLQLYKMLSDSTDRAAGCVIVFAKSKRLKLGDHILQIL